MRVALDGPDAPPLIDVDSRGSDDLGIFGEQFDFQPRINRTRDGVLRH
jgi:hypothetical protein